MAAPEAAGCIMLSAIAIEPGGPTSIGHCGPNCDGGSHGGGEGVEAVSNARAEAELAGSGYHATPAAGLSNGLAVGGAYGASLTGAAHRGAGQSE